MAGCGGNGQAAYSPSRTESCLKNAGAHVTPSGGDFVAKTAVLGTAAVSVGGKTLNVAFAKSSSGAAAILKAYKKHGDVLGSQLYTKGSVLLSWYDDPGSARSVVEGCLRAPAR